MNPLNNNSYTFSLNFVNSFGLIDITEPIKFDGASFVLEQEKTRYGRDLSFLNESLDLFFYKGVYDVAENPLQLPNGTIINHLTQGFEQLLEEYKRTGWESEVQFIIKKSGVSFITGVLDFQNAETDGVNYLSCKVVQDTAKQIIKRREDIVIDMFNDEDLDGNYIDPLQTTNILLKAKPITQESEWFLPTSTFILGSASNAINAISKSGIEDSLSYIPDNLQESGEIFKYIRAVNDLNNVNVKITNLSVTNNNITDGNISIGYKVAEEGNFGAYPFIVLDTYDDDFNIINYNKEFNIDFIPRGFVLYIYLFDTGFNASSTHFYTSGKINIRATSTAIDTVVKGVRYIDILKQTAKATGQMPLTAPKFDVGGKYYNQFAFTGNLIKGRDDLAFPVKFKDAFETITEVNADFQINDENIYVGQYADFYPNKELASLPSYPDESSKYKFNSRFAINEFSFKYKTFEEDRDEENTTDSIHTDTQWLVNNRQVENIKKVELDQIRDAFKIESARKLAIKSTTSQSDDDKLFLIDVIELAPSIKGGFSASLNHNISNGAYKILNDGSFSWAVLGFQIGASFTILTTSNAGTYTVVEITNNILTLSGNAPTSIGQQITKIEYALNNVEFTNRTNEGLVYSENLLNSDNFSNLRYSIKRNMKEWFSYLATSYSFLSLKEMKNTYFKNNGDAETRFSDESEIVIENANVTDLTNPVLTANVFETKLICSFENAVSIIQGMKTINTDNTIGGFIRTFDNNGKVIKGYPSKLDYEPSTETLTATLEERYESDLMTIVKVGDIITVNEIGYDVKELRSVWYEIHTDYLTLFDIKGIPLNNPTKYDKVSVNGFTFNNSIELSEKLIEIS